MLAGSLTPYSTRLEPSDRGLVRARAFPPDSTIMRSRPGSKGAAVNTEPTAEWLEADRTGGFASGTVDTIRTRRYHGLLLVATTPPTGRVMLVNGFEAWLETPHGRVDLSAQRYQGDVVHPRGDQAIKAFVIDPWPTWMYELPDGRSLTLEIFIAPPSARTNVRWTLAGSSAPVTLHVRPLISGRDYHALQRENTVIDLSTCRRDGILSWHTYPDQPVIANVTNGDWRDDALWYRNFLYTAERERGLDHVEDLLSPGIFTWDLQRGPAIWVTGTIDAVATLAAGSDLIGDVSQCARVEHDRRRSFATPLARAADAYLVQRGIGKTIVAGYPWFTDWGRDTFIALRGLCLATARFGDARDILLEWANTVSCGMLPNRFPDGGDVPEYNAIDASLWFVVATSELLEHTRNGPWLSSLDRERLERVILEVLEGLARGTR